MKKIRFLTILLLTFTLLFIGCASDEQKAEKTIKGFLTTLCATNYEDVKKIYKDTESQMKFYPSYFLEQLNKNFKQYLSVDVVKSGLSEYRQMILQQSNIQKISIKVDKVTVKKYIGEDNKVVYPMTTRSNTPTWRSGSKERLRPWITISKHQVTTPSDAKNSVYNYTLNASYVKPSEEKVTTETTGQLTLEKVDNEWKICFINEFNYPFKDFENQF